MKTTNKFLALALMAVAMVFASCSKDDNDPIGPTQQEIETKIVGRWKSILFNGEERLTNEREIRTYMSNGKGLNSLSKKVTYNGGITWVWENQQSFDYTIIGNEVRDKSAAFDRTVSVFSVNDKTLSLTMNKITYNGTESVLNVPAEYVKVTADYSQDILGLWEGTAMTGYETYGDYHHRIEYHADGTYTYYSWDESTQTWKPLEDVFDEWNVDGDWLATRWQNKGSDVMNYEWWDIDYIKDGIMKWYALREKEDGTRFTTTFTWKKVK